jgi:tetratricopeptide (TPR) repeat protein
VRLIAQPKQNIDSLLSVNAALSESREKFETLSHLYNAYLYSDQETALRYAREELDVSKSINYQEGIGIAYYHIGVYHNNTDQSDSARYYYLLAKAKFEEINNIGRLLGVNHGLAIIEYSQGNYDEAIAILESNVGINIEEEYDTLIRDRALNLAIAFDLIGTIQLFKGNHNLALRETLKALSILDTLNDPIRKADALNHLGNIEFYLNNYVETIDYNKEALAVYRRYNDKFYQSQVLNDIGNAYYYLEEYDSAIHYLEESVALARAMASKDLEGTVLNNLGKVYNQLEQFDKAIAHSSEALHIHEKTGSQNKIVEALNDLGMAYNEMGQYRNAMIYFNRSIDLASKIGAKENLKIGYFNRSEAYQKLNDYPSALADFKSYKATDDSIFSQTKSRQIEEMRTIYETEKKEQEIALQKNEIQLLEEKDKVNTLQRIFLIVGLGLCLVVIGLVYFAMRQKVRRKQLEKEVVDKELSFKQKELTTHALHLANKNEILEDLKTQIDQMKINGNANVNYNKLVNTINFNLQDDKSWDNFSMYFEEVHKDFNATIKQRYPDITANELRLMALLKMNLSSKEIANILNISAEGIKKARYRLRKKLSINSDETLQDMIISM